MLQTRDNMSGEVHIMVLSCEDTSGRFVCFVLTLEGCCERGGS